MHQEGETVSFPSFLVGGGGYKIACHLFAHRGTNKAAHRQQLVTSTASTKEL